MIHNFADALKEENSDREAWHWKFLYEQLWDGYATIEHIELVDDLGRQKAGIDKVITLRTNKGNIVFKNIEEKYRKRDYGDILLEIYSAVEYRTPGWAVDPDKKSDVLVYAVPTSDGIVYYVCKYPELRQWLMSNRSELSEIYPKKRANNGTYTTVNIAIPTEVVKANVSSMREYRVRNIDSILI